MGNIHSLSSELVLGGVLITAAVIYYTYLQEEQSDNLEPQAQPQAKHKGKKKKKAEPDTSFSSSTDKIDANPIVVNFPAIIPGQFDTGSVASDEPTATASQAKKPKKKKGKSKVAVTPGLASESPISTPTLSTPSNPPHNKRALPSAPSTSHSTLRSPPSIDTGTDGSWTRVESQSRRSKQNPWPQEQPSLSSDAAEDSSPATEKADEDEDIRAAWNSNEDRRTLAEKLLPKPRKTKVDDMLETPGYPSISRVMRVRPRPDEKPASGFSWADYEDVHAGEASSGAVAADVRGSAGDDADGEEEGDDDNDGWGVVKSRRRPKPNFEPSTSTQPQSAASKPSEPLTKRQRQNAAKRDAQKAVKASAEADRLATLAKHKRELEHTKMMEQFASNGKGKKGNISGGMTASVDSNGKLVWE